ncbi:glycosyltransferase family 2 protein [Xanthobacter sp. V0B-10]|uniref:glycosyltransferase family 92 protein n=1 Tax=Xanthobacter albus TaxID=3119929 RepID=UPI00372B9F89
MNVGVCLIVRDEASYLLEWIAYYRAIGFDTIVIYDNDSRDQTPILLKELDSAGLIHYRHWPDQRLTNRQVSAYEAATHEFAHLDWLAYADIDEFIVPLRDNSIKELLSRFEAFNGLAINWRIFGSSAQELRAPGLVMDRFKLASKRNARPNQCIKVVVRPGSVAKCDVHVAYLSSGTIVDEGGHDIFATMTQPGIHYRISHEFVQMNHYIVRSWEEWTTKKRRGRAAIAPEQQAEKWSDERFTRHDLNDERDEAILNFRLATLNELSVMHQILERQGRADIWNALNGYMALPDPTEVRQICHRPHQDSAAAFKPKTEAELRGGIAQAPDLLDQYGDPTFRKELMRLLLAQGRWDEAEALVPEPGGPGTGGWHHILFARAHEKAGDKEAARPHWQAFLETHPGHAEAVAALHSAATASAPKPTLPPGLDPKAPLLPRMSDPEREMFQRALEGVENFLEFGAGGSTALAARTGVKRIVSVESDVQWLDLLAQRPEIAAVDFTALHIDIGPTGAWGMPSDPAAAPKWPAYYQAVWNKLSWQPDLVLVDGRFRVACTLATILNCAPETRIVIHDFWNRPQYHVVLRHLDTLERIDTLGVFRAKPTLVVKDLVSDLLAHACNPA